MRTIGRYELLTQLASGNTGYVFSACLTDDAARSSHGADDATHAVKLIKPRLAQDARYAQLLRTEAPAAIAFRHPNAVRIVEIAQVATEVFVAMELVRGQTLATVMMRAAADRRALGRDLVVWIARQIANALATAHETPWHAGEDQGMLHGEVSPQSVLITYDGSVRVLGVGVGRSRLCLPPARSRLPYRAPELFERKRGEQTADIYGLGVVLYDALSGTRVFARDSVQETTQAVMQSEVTPIDHLAPNVGNRLADLVEAMMAREIVERPRTMAEVEELLSAEIAQSDHANEHAMAQEMRRLFAEEMVGLPWVEFTPGFLDAQNIVNAAEEAVRESTPDSGAWRIAKPRPPSPLAMFPPNFADGERRAPELTHTPKPAIAAGLEALWAQKTPMPVLDAPKPHATPVNLHPYTPPPPPPQAQPSAAQVNGAARANAYREEDEDVDSLVDRIVAASSASKTIPLGNNTPPMLRAPRSPTPATGFEEYRSSSQSSSGEKPLIVKEAFHSGAIVDIAIDPTKSKKRSPLNRSYDQSPTERAEAPPSHTPRNPAPPAPPLVEAHRMVVPQAPETVKPRDPSAPTAETDIAMLVQGDIIGGRYRVIEKLGMGGMAVVYKVEHTLLEKAMALKLLRPELSTIPYVVQRFQREARCVSQLDDPRIVRVTDFGRAENGSLFLVMELIDGEPLSLRMADYGAMELDPAMRIMEQVLLGLEHAHRNNVIHRDLKPDNIMLIDRSGDLQVKLVDFGIAKLATVAGAAGTPTAALTQAGMVFGSPRYMSPEQASGDTVDARTDIYAAGVIVYELLTGRRPFDGRSARAILSMALTQPPPPMNLQRPTPRVGKAIEEVVLTALSKDKDERYPTAAALLDALRGAVAARD